MAHYRSIVVAVDLTDESAQIVAAARELADPACTVHLAHVAEHPITGFGDLTGKNHRVSEIQIRQQLYPPLQALAESFAIPGKDLHILFGDPGDAVHSLATTVQADLIVCGSHGKQGFQLLLGSTASSILHGAQCDVLTVRIQQP